jgi:sugar-phosphatase
MITSVLFDLDGVLVDSKKVVERVWVRWAGEHGIPADDVLSYVHGRRGLEVISMFAPHLDVEEEAKRICEREAHETADLEAIPGARECVTLARAGAWAVVTSGSRELATARLSTVGLPIPDVLITSDDVSFGKPHPEPYERARERLGVAGSECVVVEDAPAGITAAKCAGMTVFAVTTTHPAAALEGADRVFRSLHDVARHLA